MFIMIVRGLEAEAPKSAPTKATGLVPELRSKELIASSGNARYNSGILGNKK
jgi:hypothetical protein